MWASASPLVEQLWGEIFQTVDSIIKVHLHFGFEKFADRINPSLEDIILSLKVVESVLDTVHNDINYSEQRLAMNAKQQILWIQILADAVKNNDQQRYDDAIAKIAKQPVV